jgi:hypothetical protein
MAGLVLWTVFGIIIALFIVFLLVSIFTKKKPEPDYKAFFIIGITWIPLGLVFNNNFLSIMGIVFMVLGIANKDKWKKQKPWNKLTKEERKQKKVLIIALGIIVLLGLAAFFYMSYIKNNEKLIGGDKDIKGCLISAGYSFNESVNACIREWELDSDARKAARIAVEYVGWKPGLTVVIAEKRIGEGCYIIGLSDANQNQIELSIENWEVKYTSR